MTQSNRELLRDMLAYVQRIEQATQDGKAVFDASSLIQDAVIRQYEVIGEIAKRLPSELLATQPDVNWKSIKGFRDFLAHNYDKIDLDIVWGAVGQLSALRAAVETLLANLPPD